MTAHDIDRCAVNGTHCDKWGVVHECCYCGDRKPRGRAPYSSVEVVDLVDGLTYRQLDYWIRTGVIRPSVRSADGSGSRRRWSEYDLVRLLAIADVADAMVAFGARQGLDVGVVARLWAEMDDGERFVNDTEVALEAGPVSIVLDLSDYVEVV